MKQYTTGFNDFFSLHFLKNMTFSYLSQMQFKSIISHGGIRQNVGRPGEGPDGIPMNTLERNDKNQLNKVQEFSLFCFLFILRNFGKNLFD